MIYKVRTHITTSTKTYHPGEILGEEFTTEEIERFCSCRAICSVGNEPVSDSDTAGQESSETDEDDKIDLLGEEELKKLSNKKAIIQYAESSGMDSMDEALTRPEMIDKVLAYQEEVFE